MKIHITIQVSGGCVTAVHSSNPNTEVKIFDYDNHDDAAMADRLEAEAVWRIMAVTPHEVA